MALEGLDKVIDNMNKQIGKIKGVTVKGVADVSLDILGKAVRDAPIDTGDLRGSGSVSFDTGTIAQGTKEGSVVMTGSVGKNAEPEATIGFSVPYAMKQHEEVGYHHPRGGKAKFLEDALKENAAQYVRHIATKVREVDR